MWGDLLVLLGNMFSGDRESNMILLKVTASMLLLAAVVLGLAVLLD